MRISDWSSDVCSSDLFCELGDFETVGIDASARFPHDLVRLVDVGDTEFVSEAELVRHRSEDLSSKSVKGIDVNISLVDPMQDAADAFTRSEEHTSELQSLNRHSYAVFCLKHKKLDNTEQTH